MLCFCAAEQRRYVREVSSSSVFSSLCGAEPEHDQEAAAGGPEAEAGPPGVGPGAPALSPPERRPPSAACSTPIARD